MLRRGFLAVCASTAMMANSAAAERNFRIAAYPTASSAIPMFARSAGMFARSDLSVTIISVSPDADPEELFRQGFDIVSGVHLFRAVPLVIDERIRARFFLFHAYNADHLFETLVAHPQSGITNLTDLAGRRVLVAQGAANLRIVRELLRRAGLPADAPVELIARPQHRFPDLLRAREADAAFALEPWGTTLETFHGFPIVARALLSHYMFEDEDGLAFFGGVIARQSVLRDRLRAMARLQEAWKEAYRTILADRDLRQQAVRLVFPDVPIAPTVGVPAVVAARDMSGTDLKQLQAALDMGRNLSLLSQRFDVTMLALNL
jgi:ABC-type nitrate/sulfonate/bicarbonate transport system substrate-binding protein